MTSRPASPTGGYPSPTFAQHTIGRRSSAIGGIAVAAGDEPDSLFIAKFGQGKANRHSNNHFYVVSIGRPNRHYGRLCYHCQLIGEPIWDNSLSNRRHKIDKHFGDALKNETNTAPNLAALWDEHTRYEFETKDAEATLETMVDENYVNHIPTMTGGYGKAALRKFYSQFFIPSIPDDWEIKPISRTVGKDQIVDEMYTSFTHSKEIPWLLPGVAPTHKRVEMVVVGIVSFKGDKIVHEHLYWDQASVLVQVGLLDPKGLPVAGAECARKALDWTLPSNEMVPDW